MAKITKRVVDALRPDPDGKDIFLWDAGDRALKGFGIRMKPSGTASYLVQYRNKEGRTRRLVIGKVGVLTPEEARTIAGDALRAATKGGDPSADCPERDLPPVGQLNGTDDVHDDLLEDNEAFTRAAQSMFDTETTRIVEEGVEMDEPFNVEAEDVDHPEPTWKDQYKARKPKFFNTVVMGYEWNKYNQTHYDHDNPPPKVVQGYKFNVFYPDLIDKTKAPTYKIEREGGRKKGQSFAPAGEDPQALVEDRRGQAEQCQGRPAAAGAQRAFNRVAGPDAGHHGEQHDAGDERGHAGRAGQPRRPRRRPPTRRSSRT
jgi:hypothetical protein